MRKVKFFDLLKYRIYIFEGALKGTLGEEAQQLIEQVSSEMGWPLDEVRALSKCGNPIYIVVTCQNKVASVNLLLVKSEEKGKLPVEKLGIEVENGSIEVALTVVHPDFRKRVWPLVLGFFTVYTIMVNNAMPMVYAALEEPIYQLYNRNYMLFQKMADSQFYWNGQTWPCGMNLDASRRMVRSKNLVRYLLYEAFRLASPLLLKRYY